MFGNGESGTGVVLLGNASLGKAVMFGHGGKAVKVLRVMSRLCEERLVRARLGKAVMARQ